MRGRSTRRLAGNETTKDYRRLMKIVVDAGFHSWVGIECEGTRLSEREGVAASLKLLEPGARTWSSGAARPPTRVFRRSRNSGSTGRNSRGSATKDFEELFACLRGRNVKALVVGGYAVAFHGRPRFTKDIDVFIGSSPENAERLLSALADFGFASSRGQTHRCTPAGLGSLTH